MANKRIIISYAILVSVGLAITFFADSNKEIRSQGVNHNATALTRDKRTSLDLSPQMKMHQLANMRSYVKAVQSIVGLIADNHFNEASEVAHTKLGMTEGMGKMCNKIDNDDFKKLGKTFHKSADTLADILKTKDTKKSLQALNTTMGYCVQCHEVFRQ